MASKKRAISKKQQLKEQCVDELHLHLHLTLNNLGTSISIKYILKEIIC